MPRLPERTPNKKIPAIREERRRQIRGLTFLVLAILLFSILRAGLDHVFTPGWWRLW